MIGCYVASDPSIQHGKMTTKQGKPALETRRGSCGCWGEKETIG